MAVKKLKYFAGGKWLDSSCENIWMFIIPARVKSLHRLPVAQKTKLTKLLHALKKHSRVGQMYPL